MSSLLDREDDWFEELEYTPTRRPIQVPEIEYDEYTINYDRFNIEEFSIQADL